MNEKTLLEQFPAELTFFPDQLFEGALVGVAERCTTPPVPVYDYLLCLRLAALDTRHEKAMNLLFENALVPAPMVLLPIEKTTFWAAVRAGRLLVWDQLHEAITGVGQRNGQRVVVYSKPAVISILETLQDTSYEELINPSVTSTLENQIQGAYLGPQTPYLLDPVLG